MAEWEAESILEPIGEVRADYRMAAICAVVTNLAGSIHSKKGQWKNVKPEDFMPKWDTAGGEGSQQQQSVTDMKKILDGLVKSTQLRARAPMDRPPRSLRGKRVRGKG